MSDQKKQSNLTKMSAAIFNKKLPRRMLWPAFGLVAGLFIGDVTTPHKAYGQIIYTPGMQADDVIFNTVDDQKLMEHPLWMPFSEGRMLDAATFTENPFALYTITTRNNRLGNLMGVKLVTAIERVDQRPTVRNTPQKP